MEVADVIGVQTRNGSVQDSEGLVQQLGVLLVGTEVGDQGLRFAHDKLFLAGLDILHWTIDLNGGPINLSINFFIQLKIIKIKNI